MGDGTTLMMTSPIGWTWIQYLPVSI